MAKRRGKKSNQRQQRTTAAPVRQQPTAVDVPSEEPSSPGDRLVALFEGIGRTLDTKPLAARAVAFVFDYLLAGMLSTAPLVIAFSLTGAQNRASLTDLVDAGMGIAGLSATVAAALAISYAYYVLIPHRLLPGRTFGKYLAHLEVVMLDGSPATLGALSLRWAFATFAETLTTFASSLALQYVGLLGGQAAGSAYLTLGTLISLLTAWRMWRDHATHRALHDIVAGTWVFTATR